MFSLSKTAGNDARAEGEGWLTPGRFAAVLGVLIVAAFPDVVLGGNTFFYRDFGLFAYPLADYHRQSFWRGQIPLWNPLNDCGLPFLAQWNTMVLYPLSLFYLLLPLSWSLGVFCLGHLFLGGLGMYFLARRWTGSALAGALAGVAFAFNGLTLQALMWTNNIAALGWMPWVVGCAEAAWSEGGRRVVLAALVGATQMLAGAPEVILLTWLVVAALWAGAAGGWHAVNGKSQRVEGRGQMARKRLGRLLVVIGLVAGLAAAQLLPFADLLAHSQRSGRFGGSAWPMPVWGWANFLVPWFRCYRSSQGVLFQHGQFWTSSYYHSVGVLALALFAVWRVRRRRVRLLAGVMAVGLVLALGNAGYLYAWMRRVLPGAGLMRYPIKFVVLPVFVMPLLAAYGVAWLESCIALGTRGVAESQRRVQERRRLLGLALGLLGLMGGILWFARRHPLPHDDWWATCLSGVSRAGFLALAVGVVLALPRARRASTRRLLSLTVLFVVWLDVSTHCPRLNPSVPRRVYQPGWATAQLKLEPAPRLGRSRALLTPDAQFRLDHSALTNPSDYYLFARLGLFANCNLLDDVPKVNGFYSLYVREADQVQGLIYVATNASTAALKDFLSVCEESAPGKATFWVGRTSYLPWATAGQQPIFGDARRTLAGLVDPRFDPRRVVLLPDEAKRFLGVTNGCAAKVVSATFGAQGADLEVAAPRSALVVVSQTFYPSWRAFVDGRPTRLWCANHAFQALEVPAGRHHVRLVYADRWFEAGAVLSLITLLFCLAAWSRASTSV